MYILYGVIAKNDRKQNWSKYGHNTEQWKACRTLNDVPCTGCIIRTKDCHKLRKLLFKDHIYHIVLTNHLLWSIKTKLSSLNTVEVPFRNLDPSQSLCASVTFSLPWGFSAVFWKNVYLNLIMLVKLNVL